GFLHEQVDQADEEPAAKPRALRSLALVVQPERDDRRPDAPFAQQHRPLGNEVEVREVHAQDLLQSYMGAQGKEAGDRGTHRQPGDGRHAIGAEGNVHPAAEDHVEIEEAGVKRQVDTQRESDDLDEEHARHADAAPHDRCLQNMSASDTVGPTMTLQEEVYCFTVNFNHLTVSINYNKAKKKIALAALRHRGRHAGHRPLQRRPDASRSGRPGGHTVRVEGWPDLAAPGSPATLPGREHPGVGHLPRRPVCVGQADVSVRAGRVFQRTDRAASAYLRVFAPARIGRERRAAAADPPGGTCAGRGSRDLCGCRGGLRRYLAGIDQRRVLHRRDHPRRGHAAGRRQPVDRVTAVPIIINLDIMLARRKVKSRALAAYIGITEQNLSLLKSSKVRGIRFGTLERICEYLECQPGDLLEFVPGESTPDDV
ncbi:hypothetical protein KCV01_g23789, partial [Aureobasidium melanogenum]